MDISSLQDLQLYIDNEIEESTELEYKSMIKVPNKIDRDKWKKELAKDVSAMANSNGGRIIYGIQEKCVDDRSIPGKLTPIAKSEMNKDTLAQLVYAHITPKIEGLSITTIEFDKDSNIFVVDIPQSTTVHQSRLTHLYYKRRNSSVYEMEDYEIRDAMNRQKFPKIDIGFSLIKIKEVTTHVEGLPILGRQRTEREETIIKYKLKYEFRNIGSIYAKYCYACIDIPEAIVADKDKVNNGFLRITEDNTIRDVVAYNGISKQYGPARYDPILPTLKLNIGSTELIFPKDVDIRDLRIHYEVFADNAAPNIKDIMLSEIARYEETEYYRHDPLNPCIGIR